MSQGLPRSELLPGCCAGGRLGCGRAFVAGIPAEDKEPAVSQLQLLAKAARRQAERTLVLLHLLSFSDSLRLAQQKDAGCPTLARCERCGRPQLLNLLTAAEAPCLPEVQAALPGSLNLTPSQSSTKLQKKSQWPSTSQTSESPKSPR